MGVLSKSVSILVFIDDICLMRTPLSIACPASAYMLMSSVAICSKPGHITELEHPHPLTHEDSIRPSAVALGDL